MLVGSRQTFGDKDEPTVSFVFAAIFSPPSIADANVFPVFLLNFIIKHEFRSLRLIKKVPTVSNASFAVSAIVPRTGEVDKGRVAKTTRDAGRTAARMD